MSILRATALRSGAAAARPAARNAAAPRLAQRMARRGYASHAEGGHKQAGSDMPWLAGAIAVTIPGVWWGLTPSAGAGHHGEDHDDHHEKHEEKEEVAEDKPDEKDSKDEEDDEKPKPQGKADAPKTKDFKPENKKRDDNKDKNVGEGVTSGPEDKQGEKQSGASNTDTRHASDPGNDPAKSKKAPGVPDTAKVKGTVKTDS